MNSYFFDTYALIEITKGNPEYLKYTENMQMLLTELNIMEYCLYLLRIGKAEEIKEAFETHEKNAVQYDSQILEQAARMKFRHSKEKLSFIDCISYLLAKRHKAKFLTGDEKFKGRENVEFVK